METMLRTRSGKIALFSVMVAATTVANLIMVPMPQPLAEYDLSPVLIYALGVLVNPALAGLIVAVAQGLGTGYKMVIYGFPPVFVLGAMLVRGVEASLISLLVRARKPTGSRAVSPWEITAMVVGVIWETIGFFVADWILFGLGMAMTVLLTIVDAIFIPPAVAIVAAVRRSLGVERLM